MDLIVVDGAARCSNFRTVREVSRTPDAAEAAIVMLLAGSESMRALGLDPSGGNADEPPAAEVAVNASDTLEGAYALLDRAQPRTTDLVASPRFQGLLLELTHYFDTHRAPAVTGSCAMRYLAGIELRDRVRARAGVRVGATVPALVIR